MSFYIGLDLGQMADYTAVAIAERLAPSGKALSAYPWQAGHALASLGTQLVQPRPVPLAPQANYHVRYLSRWALKTAYPQIVADVTALVSRPELQKDDTFLGIDDTGVGVAIFDMLRDAHLPIPLFGITIHGGAHVTSQGRRYSVPKRDLITGVQVALQSGRLKIAKDLPDAAVLTQELLNYRLKIDPLTAHDSYNARDGAHDDLVLAVALACWLGEKLGGVGPRVRRL